MSLRKLIGHAEQQNAMVSCIDFGALSDDVGKGLGDAALQCSEEFPDSRTKAIRSFKQRVASDFADQKFDLSDGVVAARFYDNSLHYGRRLKEQAIAAERKALVKHGGGSGLIGPKSMEQAHMDGRKRRYKEVSGIDVDLGQDPITRLMVEYGGSISRMHSDFKAGKLEFDPHVEVKRTRSPKHGDSYQLRFTKRK